MYAYNVTIGPEFFVKAFQDYSDRFWAFAREIMQNSIDCGSRSIAITVDRDPEKGHARVVVTNDGAPMTREILVDKLLSLGSSGKDFQAGNVGGFGKAKEILYFAHTAYNIHSGRWTVAGSGAGYDLIENDVDFEGTTSDVLWQGDVAHRLKSAFEKFIGLMPADSPIAITLNGERLYGEIDDAPANRTLEDADGHRWAYVRLSEARANSYLVRIGGIPMFTGHCDYKGLVILDLVGGSAETMTSNRDALKYPFSNQLSDFITTIAIDRASCFTLEKATYKRFAGPKFKIGDGGGVIQSPIWSPSVAARTDAATANGMGGAGIRVQDLGREEALQSVLGHEFLLKNCVRRDIPSEFNPDLLAFSDHAHWIIRAWAGTLVELHRLHEIDYPFSVGFIHSREAEAEFEDSSEYGRVFFINPCLVGEKRSVRRFKKAGRHKILADAVHEFVHGGLGERWHDEDFANKQTDCMALVLSNLPRFTRHLK